MAQLRAKQIKLAAAGDLLVGGTSGNGTTLTIGTDNQVLKVVSGVLAYATNTAADIAFTPGGTIAATTVQTAIAEVATDYAAADTALGGRIDTVEGDILNIEGEVNAIETGAGLEDDGTYVAPTGTDYLGTATSLKNADVLLDAALAALQEQVDGITGGIDITALQAEVDAIEVSVGLNTDGTLAAWDGASSDSVIEDATSVKEAVEALDVAHVALAAQVAGLAGLGALHFVGTVNGNEVNTSTITPAYQNGYVYRVTTTASTNWAGTGLEVNVGDFVVCTDSTANAGAGAWLKFDNTDPTVAAAGGQTAVTVSGNAHAGYTVGFSQAGVNFAQITGAGAPGAGQDGLYLKWDNATSSIVYEAVSAGTNTVMVEDDFTPTAAANVSIILASTPLGEVAVSVNGLKLKTTGYTVSGTTVTLVDSVNGYSYETGDTISVSYSTAA